MTKPPRGRCCCCRCAPRTYSNPFVEVARSCHQRPPADHSESYQR
jgi:hypothetical protein